MQGLRSETAAGEIGEAFAASAREIARRTTTTRPPPSGADSWFEEDIDDLVFDMVVRVSPGAIVLAAQEAESDASFASWLTVAIRSELDQRARKTPIGRVIRAVDDALREAPERFRLDGGRWTVPGQSEASTQVISVGELVSVAWTIDTQTIRVSESASKTPPMALRRDVRAVSEAVLGVAGPMSKIDLAEVLAHRFNVLFEARLGYLDLDDPASAIDAMASSANEGVESIDDEVAAHWMLEQLTAEERSLLEEVVAGASVRALAESHGCNKDRASLLRKRLVAKLRNLAEQVPDGEAVTQRLLELARRKRPLRYLPSHDGANDA